MAHLEEVLFKALRCYTDVRWGMALDLSDDGAVVGSLMDLMGEKTHGRELLVFPSTATDCYVARDRD